MKEHRIVGAFALVLFLVCIAGIANAQTAGTITFAVTPTTGASPLAQTAAWSTSPPATSCAGSWTANTLNPSATALALSPITANTSYTITCSWPGPLGSATVAWTATTKNTDGTPITDLAGYKVVYGTDATALNLSKSVPDPAALSTVVAALVPGTYTFAARAVNAAGVESANGLQGSKTIAGGAPVTASKTVATTVTKVPAPPNVISVNEIFAYRGKQNGTLWVRGNPYGSVEIGAACDASRCAADNYCVIVDNHNVWPKISQKTPILGHCGA